MRPQKLPKTLALIPDGNRRWARSHSLNLLNGYEMGVNKFISFSEWCMQYGINNIVVWAFSTENFKRKKIETRTLFSIYGKVAQDEAIIKRLHKNQTRFVVVGNMDLLPKGLRASLNKLEEETRIYQKRVINMLIGYGGRDDLLSAVRNTVKSAKDAASVTESLFGKMLLSSSVPCIDLVIRTSGEQRLSGFMPWQTEYSELYFTKKLWPEFTKGDLRAAISEYGRRQRRFGK